MSKEIQWIVRGLLIFVVMAIALSTITSPTLAQNPTPTSVPGKGMVTKPKPPTQAKSVADTPEWDKVADTVAKAAGLKNYVYESWELPATATWDDTFKYYNDQLKAAGWSGDGQVQTYADGSKGGVWIDSTTNTGVIVVFQPSPDGTKSAYDFAIFGTTTPVPKGQADWKSLPSGDLDKVASEISQALGFTDYVVEAFLAPGTTQWADVIKYYNDQMTQAGWSGQGVEQQLDKETKIGLYLDSSSKSGLVLIQISVDSSTNAVVAIFAWTSTSSASSPSSSATSSSTTSSTSSASTSSATSSSANNNLSPAATDQYPLPKGKSGFVVKSYIGDELNFNINNKLYKIPANGETFIVLDPGKYNYSVNIPGKGDTSDTVELAPDSLSGVSFTLQ